ncbi:unnamed protein product [Bursaphelenchus okinawaensis]|uniref:ShKT domain-containing protein n=1 Tax=Bursaphelenchus okinawaensis TaxID=465554 RepID=A0A811K349_9BILA|nr:unnamed protein product [Bursaphelenchus okinawaensis]CAG9089598.1 unnamed protein product [Bursaphelenchus okinawaensis]
MCNVPAYINLMKKLCPETCGCPSSIAPRFTTPSGSGGCGLDDKTIDCKKKSQMCTVPAYINLMKKLCPETCGCPSSIAPRFTTPSPNSQGSCSDKITTCASVTSQCKIQSYFTLMKQNCEKTCNFCGVNSFPG